MSLGNEMLLSVYITLKTLSLYIMDKV